MFLNFFVMKCFSIVFVLFCFVFNIQAQQSFSEEALEDMLIDLEGNQISFADVLSKHKGKKVMVDIWASWCGDCRRGLPGVQKIQKENKALDYLFLSLDKNTDDWKKGIEKFKIKGSHYFVKSGWKGPIGKAVELDWIPRYMVLDKSGSISLYKAVETTDKKLIKAIKI